MNADQLATPTTLNAQDLRQQIIAAAITAADQRIADLERSDLPTPDNRVLVQAAVVAEALAWFEEDHNDAWHQEQWEASAESAIDYITEPTQVAAVIEVHMRGHR